MLPAQARLAADLEAIEFRDLSVPLVTNVDARVITKGAEAREALVRRYLPLARQLAARH